MSAISEQQVRERLAVVKYPGFTRDIVSFGLVKNIEISDAGVTVQMALATNVPSIPQAIKDQSEAVLKTIPGVGGVRVLIDIQAPAQAAGVGAASLPGIKHVIAIASGK